MNFFLFRRMVSTYLQLDVQLQVPVQRGARAERLRTIAKAKTPQVSEWNVTEKGPEEIVPVQCSQKHRALHKLGMV